MATKNEAKIKFTADTGNFNDSIKKANAEMKQFGAELKLSETQMARAGETVEGLENKHNILEKQLAASQTKTDALSQKIQKATEYFGENSIEVTNLKTQLLNAQREQERFVTKLQNCNEKLEEQRAAEAELNSETNKLTKKISEQETELQQLKDEYVEAALKYGDSSDEAQTLADKIGELSADLDGNKKKLSNATNAADTFAQTLGRTEETTEEVETATERLSSIINEQQADLARLKGEYTELVLEQRDTTDEAQELERAIGVLSAELEENKKRLADAAREADEFDVSLNKIDDSASDAETATEQLTNKIKAQESQLAKLKSEYSDFVLKGEEATDEAKDLERAIGELSTELKQSKTALAAAADKADELDKSLENVDDSASDVGYGFTVLKGTFADLASSAIQGAIAKVGEFISYLGELPAATMELRQNLATLSTSFDTAGLSTSQAKDTWKKLYAVIGDDAQAVEASNHISKMADNQKDLNDWVTISTGIFGTYQDSLPIEGLAEASNETAKTGVVTGVLADALNWSSEAATMFASYMSEEVTTAEDAFNVALSECANEQERQALITDTLIALYGDAADTYRETASAQMEAKEATAENMLAENNLATAIEPVTTAFTELMTTLMNAFAPAIEAVSGKMVEALEWANEHPVAMKAIAAAVGVLAVGLGGLAIAAGIYTAAQWAMNSAILANPITWVIVGIIAAIAAVVAIIVVVIEYWDEIVVAVKNCVSCISAAWGAFCSWIDSNVIQPVSNFFTGLWDGFENGAANAWSAVKSIFSKVTSFFKDIFSNAWSAVKNVFSVGGKIFSGIKDGIVNAFKNVVNIIIKGINKVVAVPFNGLNNTLNKISGLEIVGVKPFSWLTWRAPVPEIPLMANGGILTRPTLNIAGEAGPEAIIPLNKLEGYISGAIERAQNVVNLQLLADVIEDLARRPIEMSIDGRSFAIATASECDNVNGLRSIFKNRGLAL